MLFRSIVDRKNFKSYAELKARLDDVLGFTGSAPAPKAPVVDEEAPWEPAPKAAAPKKAPAPVVDEEEDEDLAMFRKLAED